MVKSCLRTLGQGNKKPGVILAIDHKICNVTSINVLWPGYGIKMLSLCFDGLFLKINALFTQAKVFAKIISKSV
jgi:hypothetical protein